MQMIINMPGITPCHLSSKTLVYVFLTRSTSFVVPTDIHILFPADRYGLALSLPALSRVVTLAVYNNYVCA
jgi:hypothetical protein